MFMPREQIILKSRYRREAWSRSQYVPTSPSSAARGEGGAAHRTRARGPAAEWTSKRPRAPLQARLGRAEHRASRTTDPQPQLPGSARLGEQRRKAWSGSQYVPTSPSSAVRRQRAARRLVDLRKRRSARSAEMRGGREGLGAPRPRP